VIKATSSTPPRKCRPASTTHAVDDESMKYLEMASAELGRSIEQLAEAAIENAAIEYKVSRMGVAVSFCSREARMKMTGAEALKLTGRKKRWLQRNTCAFCDQSLWRTLIYGCSAIYQKCDPTKRDFSDKGALKTAEGNSK